MHVNLLIVDDHLPIIEGYKSILSFNKSGYTIETTAATSLERAYKIITQEPKTTFFDAVFIDLTLPEYPEQKLFTGEDLVPVVKKHLPNAKIAILTSHAESILMYRILNESNPNGILVKSDFTSEEFLVAFGVIMKGENYYSTTVLNYKKQLVPGNKIFDSYNRQIIQLLSQGVKTKNIQEILHLSKSAVDKRKAAIKEMLDIDKGTDEDILREARKRGLI
ncbi:MAG: response regulator transcription factor [Flavobacterium sp.]|nr:response regulator transcription factor [Flavobacterium sp.]